MNYMTVITVGSFAISLIAVSIAIHTKLQQKKSSKLRDLAEELDEIEEIIKNNIDRAINPEEDMDLSLSLESIGKEAVTCSHETGKTVVDVGVEMKHIYTEDGEIDSKDVNSIDDLYNLCVNKELVSIDIIIGSRDEMYSTRNHVDFNNPMLQMYTISKNIENIRKEYQDQIDTFDSSIIKQLEKYMDKVTKRSSENIINRGGSLQVNVDEFESVEKMGEYVFEVLVYYDGFEDDIAELEELQEEIEELRKTVLQASYS